VHEVFRKFDVCWLFVFIPDGDNVEQFPCRVCVGVESCFLQVSSAALLIHRHYPGGFVVQETSLNCFGILGGVQQGQIPVQITQNSGKFCRVLFLVMFAVAFPLGRGFNVPHVTR